LCCIDFDKIEEESFLKNIDHLYIALGTTIKKAGSKEKFELVDYHYCYNLAIAAKKKGVKRISLVSSVGSNPQSKLLYPRVKGMIERDLTALSFKHLSIAKPGIILFGPLRKYKSISADDISKAMIFQVVNSKNKLNVLHYNELEFSSNSFSGDRVGLIGKNGAGKSTLLKLLSKEAEFDSGSIAYEKDLKIGFLKQDIDFEKGRTVLEEAYQAFSEIKILEKKQNQINLKLMKDMN